MPSPSTPTPRLNHLYSSEKSPSAFYSLFLEFSELTTCDPRCALFWGGISEGLIFLHFLNLLRKSYFGEKCDEASSTRARKDLRELMWSSVILIAVCHLFACFHYYLFYLPFNIVFYFHLRVLWPLNSLMYPLVIWAMPTFARMSLCSMIDPIINPIRHTKTQ
jgi:hypothetical protein